MKSYLVKSIRNLFTVCALIGVMVIGAGSASATSPFYKDLLLTIPRIDVEGFGPLKVVLRLENEATVTFGLFSADAADTSITPTASFDVGTGVLSIPTVKVDDIVYDVEMQLMAGETFQLGAAAEVNFAGQSQFQNMCMGCHGANGQGVSAPPLVDCFRCGDVDALTSYIDSAMPRNGPGNCVGQCAADIAAYVRAVFNAGG